MFRVEQIRGERVAKETRNIHEVKRARAVAEHYLDEGCDSVCIWRDDILLESLSSSWEPESTSSQSMAIVLVLPGRGPIETQSNDEHTGMYL